MPWFKKDGKWQYRNAVGRVLSPKWMEKSAKSYAGELGISQKAAYKKLFGTKPSQ